MKKVSTSSSSSWATIRATASLQVPDKSPVNCRIAIASSRIREMSTEVEAAPTPSSITTSTFAFVGGPKKAQHGLRVNGKSP
jgi:hypothetical protein